MTRLLRLALLLLLFATLAGQGVATAQMARCELPPAPMHHTGLHAGAGESAADDHCHAAPQDRTSHALGLCCQACVNGALPTLDSAAVERLARRLVFATHHETYRGLSPAPLHRPPRAAA